jgi:hypothetical protein
MILAHRKKEVIMCKEENDFFQRILVEIIYTVNLILENDKAIAACYLQSNNILIIFKKIANIYKTDDI